MSSLFKRLFGPKKEAVVAVNHPTLGTLTYDSESESWCKSISISGEQVRLSVGGEYEPDPVLLEHAAALETRIPQLFAQLPAFLEREAARTPELADEIRSLRASEVAVWWSKDPDAVMLWFKGPSEDRIWHCDYRKGVLGGLAFDD